MEIIPAIDLRQGRCVRLFQGDYEKETVYFEDPLEGALHWERQGACRIHVVDLDGAAAGLPVHLDVLKQMVMLAGVPLQVGGGIRSLEIAEILIGVGVERIVLGTSAVQDPDLVAMACHTVGSKAVVVAVDARDGRVAINGWRERTSYSALRLVREMADLGVERFIYTDIARDGTLTEPNFQAVEELVEETGLSILASGGISSVKHLTRLAQLGVEGAIVGRALYTGDIDLQEAIRLVAGAG